MAVHKIELSEEDQGRIKVLHGQTQSLASNHSKIRIEFLGLEMRLIQQKTEIEKQVRSFVQEVAGAEAGILGFNIDLEEGVLAVEVQDSENVVEEGDVDIPEPSDSE
jgi:hypothetical protein